MKERHKRKEVYSFILISHMDNQSRQFTISAVKLRLLCGLFLLLCMGLAFGAYQLTAKGYRQYQLQKQIEEKNSELEKMRSTMTKLESTLEILTQENQSLQQSIELQEEGEEEKGGADLSLPRLYPSDGVGDLKSTFTTEAPYITIGMRKGDNVVATGDGVVSRVDYDANYLNSVEIVHESGYISRYLCDKDVEIRVKEGEEIKARNPLFTITIDYSLLDYQILLDNQAVNPFQVMKVDHVK